eukprot:7003307-Heterocapsa_arctica.AAC.1
MRSLPVEGWAGCETETVPSSLVTDRSCLVVRGTRQRSQPLHGTAACATRCARPQPLTLAEYQFCLSFLSLIKLLLRD